MRISMVLSEELKPSPSLGSVDLAAQVGERLGHRLLAILHPELNQFEPAVQQQIREV